MSTTFLIGDARTHLRALPDEQFNCVVCSPPYFGLRDYGVQGQIGLEATPDTYVTELVGLFREVRRTLRSDGTLWVNLGDSYAGSWGAQSREHAGKHAPNVSALSANQVKAAAIRDHGTGSLSRTPGLKAKDLIGIPWRVAFALQADGWWLRAAIVWAKPNGMPGSQQDRCTSSYEMIFHLSRSADYWCDFDAIKTPPRESNLIRAAQASQAQAGSHRTDGLHRSGLSGAPHGRHALGDALPEKERRSDKQRGHSRRHAGFNDRWDLMERNEQQARPAMMRDVWFVAPAAFAGPHFAVMPEEIARRCIAAGCPPNGSVLDPFGGVGTTAVVADQMGRDCTLIELNPSHAAMARARVEASRMGRVEGIIHLAKVVGHAPDFGPLFSAYGTTP